MRRASYKPAYLISIYPNYGMNNICGDLPFIWFLVKMIFLQLWTEDILRNEFI